MANHIDRLLEELDASMTRLGEAMRGIPVRRGSFKKTYDNLRRDVAQVTTMLDAARPVLRADD